MQFCNRLLNVPLEFMASTRNEGTILLDDCVWSYDTLIQVSGKMFIDCVFVVLQVGFPSRSRVRTSITQSAARRCQLQKLIEQLRSFSFSLGFFLYFVSLFNLPGFSQLFIARFCYFLHLKIYKQQSSVYSCYFPDISMYFPLNK